MCGDPMLVECLSMFSVINCYQPPQNSSVKGSDTACLPPPPSPGGHPVQPSAQRAQDARAEHGAHAGEAGQDEGGGGGAGAGPGPGAQGEGQGWRPPHRQRGPVSFLLWGCERGRAGVWCWWSLGCWRGAVRQCMQGVYRQGVWLAVITSHTSVTRPPPKPLAPPTIGEQT